MDQNSYISDNINPDVKNKKSFSFDIVHLLLVITAIFFGIIGYFAGKNSKQLPPNIPVPTLVIAPTIKPTVIPTHIINVDESVQIKTAACKNITKYRCEANIVKIEGNYATGTLTQFIDNEGGPGSVWITAKINNEWKYIWGGQEAPDCKTMNKYSVPKTIYDSCW